ncbi:MAG: aldolase, partial [Verrucomicrobiae bacterium]|nr:aldolase [Verrucomicrobiae bacterium]
EPVLTAAKQIADATLAAGKVFGSITFNQEHSKRLQDMGARMIIHGADIVSYKKALKDILGEYGR